MKILFLTQRAPYGFGEAFIIDELLAFSRSEQIMIIPMRPVREAVHSDGAPLLSLTHKSPLVTTSMLFGMFGEALLSPRKFMAVLKLLLGCKSTVHFLKNLAILPKAYLIARVVRRGGIEHIHSYWASTSSTAAMIAAILGNIPWSMTCYRWDISDDNLVKLKIQMSAFTRVADDQGRGELIALAGTELGNKIFTIRSGVRVLPPPKMLRGKEAVRIVVPALLVEKKGHMVLLKALSLVKSTGRLFECFLLGDGPMRTAIEFEIEARNLRPQVQLLGLIDHFEILKMYSEGAVDVVVLPSIVTSAGEREGIPISLIEAMAAGLPVVSTPTGGIPELVTQDRGILVPAGDVRSLSTAICRLIDDPQYANALGQQARLHVLEKYEVSTVVAKIRSKITTTSPMVEN